MDSTVKKSGCESRQEQDYAASNDDYSLTQVKLMKVWRDNQGYLLQQLGISDYSDPKLVRLNGITPEVVMSLNYLNKTEELLEQDSDFTLSPKGFEKYKSAHFISLKFLTETYEQRKAQEQAISAKFYFFSRAKHIAQQKKSIPWHFTLFHFILLLVSAFWSASILLGAFAVTQKNHYVFVLITLSLINIYSIVRKRTQKYKITALTPFRFLVSYFSICSLITALYALLFVFLPFFIASKVNQYWRDDFILCGLVVFLFVVWGHSRNNGKSIGNGGSQELEVGITGKSKDSEGGTNV
ncbi:hypothetical protein Q4601_14320 [Shewanella sp. 1_MG-2023]|uniref:hypothetical protein n=1 Tax=unclassified Shewanella TaxID=196818 RepID=UPI0026E4309C|nr:MULTISPECIES: hypothetical protein [unclassified Shewanella]MDO6611384.1 hypothetical protein [Shewanella sp. 7_MG-2023]MDO6771239.1 hypothetical protein [Shewanella sp. 2_MG-2023]MDO6795480.1 hypothetical protein [Shewanella sp. 1_MG-2023]